MDHKSGGSDFTLNAARRVDLRGSLGGVGVFPLATPLAVTFGRDVVAHLPVVAHLVSLGHVLKTLLVAGRQSLSSHTHTHTLSVGTKNVRYGLKN